MGVHALGSKFGGSGLSGRQPRSRQSEPRMALRGLQHFSRHLAAGRIGSSHPAACLFSFTSLASCSSSNQDHRADCSCDACARSCSSSSRGPVSWDSVALHQDHACSHGCLCKQHVQRRPSVTAIRTMMQLPTPLLLQQQRLCMSTRAQQAEAAPEPVHGKESSAGSSSMDPMATQEPEKERQPPLSQDVYYEGPLSKTHKILKMVSISNTMIACAAAPLIVMYADISYVSRIGLASSLVIFGLLTTGALHWITNPYVHELKFHAASQQIDVRTVTLLGGHRWRTFHLSDVKPLPWDRPVATFIAKDRFYYIDVYSFPDEDLLKRLTPDEASVPKGYKEDEDD